MGLRLRGVLPEHGEGGGEGAKEKEAAKEGEDAASVTTTESGWEVLEKGGHLLLEQIEQAFRVDLALFRRGEHDLAVVEVNGRHSKAAGANLQANDFEQVLCLVGQRAEPIE